MVKKSNSIGYPYVIELCFCRVSNFPLPYFCLQISMNVPNISRFLFMPDSGCFLCFPLKFARENGAWSAKIAPLAYALRLTAVLLRSSFINASETLGNNMKYLTSSRTRAFSEKRMASHQKTSYAKMTKKTEHLEGIYLWYCCLENEIFNCR